LAANDVVDDILEVVVNALIIGPLFFAAWHNSWHKWMQT
jgi:hypothetical protein